MDGVDGDGWRWMEMDGDGWGWVGLKNELGGDGEGEGGRPRVPVRERSGFTAREKTQVWEARTVR
jgi:hypothetical protein